MASVKQTAAKPRPNGPRQRKKASQPSVRDMVEKVLDSRSELLFSYSYCSSLSCPLLTIPPAVPTLNTFQSVLPSYGAGFVPTVYVAGTSYEAFVQPQVNLTIEADFIDIAVRIYGSLGDPVRVLLVEDRQANGPTPSIATPVGSSVLSGASYLAIPSIASRQLLAGPDRPAPRLRALVDEIVTTHNTQTSVAFQKRISLGRRVVQFTPDGTTGGPGLTPANYDYLFIVLACATGGTNTVSYDGLVTFGFRNRA